MRCRWTVAVRRARAGAAASAMGRLILLWAVLFGAASLPAHADTGMLAWEDGEIVQALDAFVPRLMQEANVPGAQVAFMRGGTLLYERGFGVRNVLGRAPVTTDTLFEAASLSKPIAAHLALQLVASGRLHLDTDLGAELTPPWLAPGADGRIAEISLRQVLSHTSGLSNDILRTSHRPDPALHGRFAYGGEGFGYLGYAIAAHEQRPFDAVARQRLLQPLGMHATGFAVADARMQRMATGHAQVWMPVALVLVPFALIYGVGVVIAILVGRLFFHHLHVQPLSFLLPAIVAAIGSIVVVIEVAGLGLLLSVLVVTLGFLLCGVLATVAWRLVLLLLGMTRARPGTVVRREEVTTGFWKRLAYVLGFVSVLPLLFFNVPLPLRAGDDVHPASSVRGTAGEIVLFAREIVSPTLLERADITTMTSPQVAVDTAVGTDKIFWGLGIGIRERALADGAVQRTFWQWGLNPGYASLMVIEPQTQAALVILTNAQTGGPMVQELAAHVFGGIDSVRAGGGWRLPYAAMAPLF